MSLNEFTLFRLEPTSPRPPFDCKDDDLNEFYSNDSIKYGNELLAVTYIAKHDGKVLAYFSVSNDSIKREELTGSEVKRVHKTVPHPKRLKTMPAVKIGRLATCQEKQCKGLGTDILDYIKVWFTQGNKTGCRFVLVDAYNSERIIKFYQKNGFVFLSKQDSDEKTRLMYFDLYTFRKN